MTTDAADLRVSPDDPLAKIGRNLKDCCLYCQRLVGDYHRPSCQIVRERFRSRPTERRYRWIKVED